ncbi:MAG TPA: adenylate/guanylate cyclase domain-containing protein, partial [Methylomirabilota bacterium]|nr:adenylate/guanylate cyclase domain-containing protein [Methylomirabilota bacterium]
VIPTDESGQLLINYLGPPKTIAQVSVTDILKGRTAAGTFKDRLVLVGATALGTYDLRNTPFSPLYPGTEVHASVIENILTRSFMARPQWSRIFDVLAIVTLGGVVGAVLPRLSPIKGVAFAAGLFALYVLAARALFVHAHVWLNMVYPLLTLSGTYTALTAYYYVTEQRQRKQVKDTFRQYVAPLVVEEMLKDPGRLKLGGEEKVLTVLFCDLEGFTSHSERYSPPEMAEMLGEYYNRITEQVFIHRGTLKEYVGDELMAIFGAPLEQPDHAVRACAAALAMREQRLALAAEWATVGRPRLRARTGINSGPMLVGNLGSRYRFAYGVLGDQVNLGSRLEGLNKAYRTDILIGENTARLVEGEFLLREVDMVRVIGRSQSVRIYELLAKHGVPVALEQEKALRSYAAGLEAYRQQVWDEALALFTQALTLWPADGPSRTMAERCEHYQKTPPPEQWDGVFEQEFKK